MTVISIANFKIHIMGKKSNSRREFLKISSVGGLGAVLGVNMMPPPSVKVGDVVNDRALSIHPRYHRWYVNPGVEWLETNTGYATLNWSIPISRTALVLVDVWQRHYIKDTEARIEVYNQLGQKINELNESGVIKAVSTAGWVPGMYVIRVQSAGGKWLVSRLVVL